MTAVAEALADEARITDFRAALARATVAAAADRKAREVYAARLNAAGNYVLTVRGLSDRARRELLALLYGNDKT